ncbi:MAG: dockerin type I domain-containing protein [Chthoniobacterales bacterium]
MKRSNAVARQICWLVIMAGVAIFSASGFAGGSAAATAITIVDQNGRPVPNTPPSNISQIYDVTVGPNGTLVFSPDPVTISVGDTVRWTWGSGGHSSTSGTPGFPNGLWDSGILNQGQMFSHTFNTAGSFPYYCTVHGQCCGMTGTINVESAPMAQSAFSRKVHGGAGTFDVPLPLTGNVGVECRSGGGTNDYQMIIGFATSVTVGGAALTTGTGSVSSFSVSGSEVTVNLTGVTNVQRITVTLMNVNDGTHMGNVPVSMGVLVGDVNGNAAVSAADVALTKSQVGATVSGSNFREDVNANGVINSVDVALVKSTVGTALPP